MDTTGLKVRDLMRPGVHTLGRNDRLALAEDLMQQERIRHLLVLDEDGMLAGVVSQRDLFRGALLRALGYGGRAERRLLESMAVKEAMVEPVYTTTPETPLADAAREMCRHKIGCLPVVEAGRLVGILTEGDFVRWAAQS